jgi:hypothetical protein
MSTKLLEILRMGVIRYYAFVRYKKKVVLDLERRAGIYRYQ